MAGARPASRRRLQLGPLYPRRNREHNVFLVMGTRLAGGKLAKTRGIRGANRARRKAAGGIDQELVGLFSPALPVFTLALPVFLRVAAAFGVPLAAAFLRVVFARPVFLPVAFFFPVFFFPVVFLPELFLPVAPPRGARGGNSKP